MTKAWNGIGLEACLSDSRGSWIGDRTDAKVCVGSAGSWDERGTDAVTAALGLCLFGHLLKIVDWNRRYFRYNTPERGSW